MYILLLAYLDHLSISQTSMVKISIHGTLILIAYWKTVSFVRRVYRVSVVSVTELRPFGQSLMKCCAELNAALRDDYVAPFPRSELASSDALEI